MEETELPANNRVMDWVHLIALSSPTVHVHVDNFPGPDKVAKDTLSVAQDTLAWAKAAVWVSASVGVITFLDYLLTRSLALAKPSLSFLFNGNPVADFQAGTRQIEIGGAPLDEFDFNVSVVNSGKANAKHLRFTLWLPDKVEFKETPPVEKVDSHGQLSSNYIGYRISDAEAIVAVPNLLFVLKCAVEDLEPISFYYEYLYEHSKTCGFRPGIVRPIRERKTASTDSTAQPF